MPETQPYQRIVLPDGSTALFPADMPDDEITRVLSEQAMPEPGPILGRERRGALSDISPQDVLDFAGQGLGAAGGAAAGALSPIAAPATIPAGAAAGSVLGKRLAREVGQYLNLDGSQQPDLMSAETALDAAAGAVGPVAGSAMRGAGRALTGLERGGVSAAERSAAQTARKIRRGEFDKLSDEETLKMLRELPPVGSGEATINSLAQHAKEHEINEAIKVALARATQRGAAETALPGGIVGALVSTVDPVVGGLIGAGISHVVIRNAVPVLLRSRSGPAFARWALNLNKTRAPDALKSLLAIGIEQDLTREERRALNAIASDIRPDGPQRHSLRGPDGKFKTAAVDRSQLEALFSKGPFG